MSMIYSGNSITFPDGTTQNTVALPGMRNRIINGAMMIDQRNAGASVSTASGSSGYTVDRMKIWYTQTSKFTAQQNAGSVTPPVGFKNYLGITSSSAYSVLSTDHFLVGQQIEGTNCADLAFGTANAATFTLSFRVYSSLTGTFGGALGNTDSTRSYPFTYTISSANTWTNISITVAGDTTGTWNTDSTGSGLVVYFGLGVGSSKSNTAGAWAAGAYYSATGAQSIVGTNGATWYITGLQIEKGSTATSFDYRPYGTELALCQRYYQTSYTGAAVGSASTTNQIDTWSPTTVTGVFTQVIYLPVKMRASLTAQIYSPVTGASGKVSLYPNGSGNDISAAYFGLGSSQFSWYVSSATTTSGYNINYHYTASAEL